MHRLVLVKILCIFFALPLALCSAPITRHKDQVVLSHTPPISCERERYPWEEAYIGEHPRITKEYFRCKGSALNPMKLVDGEHYHDCRGGYVHGLPLIGEEENVYPIMLTLLNHIQEKSGKRVIITCGHRCPAHNGYADPSKFNATSKHQIGAEVDFYVQGLEHDPQAVVDLLLSYYGADDFKRYHGDKTDVSTPPWYNKEVFIKLFLEHEGRDFDNRHPYSYVCIQVRRDCEREEAVIYEWKRAHYNYKRD